MRLRITRLLAVVAMVAALVSVGSPAAAQQYTGRIDLTVEDSTGGRLPGVTVELTGQMIQSAVTDARGEAHFLNLTVGKYNVRATLTGFNDWKSTGVPVAAGVSVPLNIKLGVAGAKEEVVVTAEAPVLDNKKQTTSTSVSLEELQNVPTARDPWVVMSSVPGIVMDRVNVGGSESGQQSGFMGKGAGSGDTTWNVDGMPITDMSSLSSPFYFDFDMFQEMSITTGGSDPKSGTGGVQMNFMLRSGTNSFHGNAKGYASTEGMQSENMPADLKASLGGKTGKGDRTHLFQDWGGDVGGPILKDKWWFWVARGDQDIRIIKSVTAATDRTVLQNSSLKTNAQLTKSLRASFTFFQAAKKKWGRNASATVSQPSTVDQDGVGGPNRMFKAEVNYNLGSSLFFVGRYAHVRGGFQLIPEGGINTLTYIDAGSIQRGSASTYITSRPQDSFIVDGNYFKGNHEIKFGFGWRKAEVHSTSVYGQDYYSQADAPGYVLGDGNLGVNVNAPFASDVSAKYMNFYIGDTITLKRMTINAGVRFDNQVASVLPSIEAAPANVNNILPSVTAPGVENALTFNLLQPRVGITYSVTENRKTQLRATYAMFTSQIGAGQASFMSVAQYRGFYLDAKDLNHDGIAQPNEFLWTGPYGYAAHIANGDYWGYDPANPSKISTTSINKIGNYGNPKTHEIIIGVDHELIPNFGVSASFTYRKIVDFNWRPTIQNGGNGVIDGGDYTLKGNVTGNLPTGVPGSPSGTYSVPYYGLTSGIVFDPSKGGLYQTRPDYNQVYKGFEISATKRMSSHWMARFGFSTNSWREYFASPAGRFNPTPTLTNPNIDGGYVVSAAGGSGKSSIYMVQPSYQIIANGAYQLPYDVDLGANFIYRQGYPMPWNRSTSGGFSDALGSSKTLLLPSDFGMARLPAISSLDLRIGKRQKISKVTLNFDLDIFNITNNATVLGREYKYTSGNYTLVREIMQPRILRLGLRVQF
ncbi:MAG TPA: carboxypeptidase regulatory-like domain-containing protein [Vicinamibacterales bacterium]|jgi:hypothetical protein